MIGGPAAGATPFGSLRATAPALDVAVSASDVALLPTSSGTTGLPKSVELTHRNLVASLGQTWAAHQVAEDDVVIAALYGVFGYWMIKHDFEPAPLLLGFVLGPLMEENLRRAMLIARGDATVFFTRPISGGLLSVAILLLILAVLPMIRKRRAEVFVE